MMRRTLYPLLLIVFIGCIACANIINNDFVFDDISTIKDNKIIRDWRNISMLFNRNYFSEVGLSGYSTSGEASYRPLVTLSYFIDYSLWGANSIGYHITNLFLHLSTIVLFYMFVMRLGIGRLPALFASILYAVHPVLTEAINCTSFREDILCALFFYAALSLYFSNRDRFGVITAVLAAASMFSKEMGVMILPVVIILDLVFYKNTLRNRLIAYSSIGMATLCYIIIRFVLMKNNRPEIIPYPAEGLFMNIGVMSWIVIKYIRLSLYPVNLTVDYYIDPPHSFEVRYVLSLFIVTFLIGLIVVRFVRMLRAGRKPDLSIWMLLFFVALVPVMNIIPIKNIIAERYLYVPFGFAAIFGAQLIRPLYSFRTRQICMLSIFLIILCCTCLTVSRNEVWSSGFSLWTETLRENPRSFHAHNNLGSWYDGINQTARAIRHYEHAIRLRPQDAIPFFNLANTFKRVQKYKQALYYYSEAAKRTDRGAEPYVNMGNIYAYIAQYEKAEKMLRFAVKIDPTNSSAHNNLGAVLSMQQKYDESTAEHLTAIKLDPSNEKAYINLALNFLDQQLSRKALRVLEKLEQINPHHAQLYYYMGLCYEQMERYDKAKMLYQHSLVTDGDTTNARQGLERLSQ